MNKKIKSAWLKALRSGKYMQGRGVLRIQSPQGDRHCCLGVLCDIISPRSWRQCGDKYIHGGGALSHITIPGDKISEDSGVRLSQMTMLASMNDAGKSFEEIADYIEYNL